MEDWRNYVAAAENNDFDVLIFHNLRNAFHHQWY